MKRIIIYIVLLVTMSNLLSSCDSMLAIEPRQYIDADDALTSHKAITAATNGVYARLREVNLYGRDLIALPDVLADNTINT